MISHRQADLLNTFNEPSPAFYVYDPRPMSKKIYDPKTREIHYDDSKHEVFGCDIFKRPEGFVIYNPDSILRKHPQVWDRKYKFVGYFWGIDDEGNFLISSSDFRPADLKTYDPVHYYVNDEHEQGLLLSERP
jgi:hypothetical protein